MVIIHLKTLFYKYLLNFVFKNKLIIFIYDAFQYVSPIQPKI